MTAIALLQNTGSDMPITGDIRAIAQPEAMMLNDKPN